MTSFHDVSIAQLKQIIDLKEQIEALQEKLSGLRGGAARKKKLGRPAGKQKRTMSPATIAKMRAAQQKRWAHLKKSPEKSAPAKAASKKKTMSPEAKAKIAAAMKARWAGRKKTE